MRLLAITAAALVLSFGGGPAMAFFMGESTAFAYFTTLDCHPVNVATGAPGTQVTFNESTCTLTIPAGAQGAIGPQGPTGAKGDKGDTGAQGPAGTNGTNGTNGANGVSGWEKVSAQFTLNFASVAINSRTVSCTAGKKPVGGGGTLTNASGVVLKESFPTATNDGWTVTYENTTTSARNSAVLTAYAICVTAL